MTAGGLTDEQQSFVEAIRDFADRERFDGDDSHQGEVAARMAELGWYGLTIDEDYGGAGGSFLDAALFLEETARGQIPIGAYGVTLIVVGALNRFGTEDQKRDLLGRVAKGGSLAIAMSEPEAGSDVASLKTRARREDGTRSGSGEWVIDGAKMWCSFAHKASHVLIVCRSGEGSERHEGLSMLLVPREAKGGSLAIAMSEPEAGSDVASLKTRARRDTHAGTGDGNGEWVIDGTKMWCSFAHKASHVLIVCRSGEGSERHEGLSMLLVPREAEGFTMTPIPTLGGHETNELHLDGVRVPEEALLGGEGAGWTLLLAGLNNERVILAASALGLAQRTFDDALSYAKERRQFGRPIGSFQAIQHKFAELATSLAQVRLLVRWVARLTDEDPGRMLPQEASMAKLAATELAKRCALEGMQIMGGYGYATEYPMERHLRAAVATTIYGGTSEIQKNIIAKTLGL